MVFYLTKVNLIGILIGRFMHEKHIVLICLIGPAGSIMEKISLKVKKRFEGAYEINAEPAFEHFYDDHIHTEMSQNESKKECSNWEAAVSRSMIGFMPILLFNGNKTLIVKGFPFTVKQAELLLNKWPNLQLIIYFLCSASDEKDESWDKGKDEFCKALRVFVSEKSPNAEFNVV